MLIKALTSFFVYLIVNFQPANIFYHVIFNPLRPGEVWWEKLNTNFHCNFINKIPLYQRKFWLSIISMALWTYKSALVQQISDSTFCHICRQILCFCRQKVLYASFCHLCGRNRFLPAKGQPCLIYMHPIRAYKSLICTKWIR